jgi:hypothetical protein
LVVRREGRAGFRNNYEDEDDDDDDDDDDDYDDDDTLLGDHPVPGVMETSSGGFLGY